MPRAIREITLAVVFHILLCIPSATTFVAAPLHHAQRFQTEARRTAAVSHTRRTSLRASPLACSYGPIVIQNGGVDALRVVPCGAGIPVAGPSQSGTNEVLIDATDGWGDGHHATTRCTLQTTKSERTPRQLALRFLVKHAREGQLVLDYGTGSGVCGLAALKLGCSEVLGVDIDDEAIDGAWENVARNNLEGRMEVCHTREIVQDLDGIVMRDAPEKGARQFDLVVANILVGPLMKLAPVLALALKEGDGVLCLTGLREEHVPPLAEQYRRFGVEFEAELAEEEHTNWRVGAEGEGRWVQATGRRRALTPEERRETLRYFSDAAVQ